MIKHDDNTVKKFDILTSNLNVLHFDPTKIFSIYVSS